MIDVEKFTLSNIEELIHIRFNQTDFKSSVNSIKEAQNKLFKSKVFISSQKKTSI